MSNHWTNEQFAEAVEDAFGHYPDDDGSSPLYIVYKRGDETWTRGQETGSRSNADRKAGDKVYNSFVDFMYDFVFPVAAIERASENVYWMNPMNPGSGFMWDQPTALDSIR